MDQPLAVAFTAFADAWPRAIETEIGAALCVIGRGKGLYLTGHYQIGAVDLKLSIIHFNDESWKTLKIPCILLRFPDI